MNNFAYGEPDRSREHRGQARLMNMSVQQFPRPTKALVDSAAGTEISLYLLRALALHASIAAGSPVINLPEEDTDISRAVDITINVWVHALDQRARETDGHTQRVTDMTVRVARGMGMSESDLVHVRRSAQLHDIGKMTIPDHILLKPAALTDDEWSIMRRHPIYAYELLLPIAYLHPAIDIPYCHHEKWDGTGYPRELRGEEIPLAARIFAVVDVWDAMRSARSYRAPWPEDQVRLYIHEQSFTHFDPNVVKSFLSLDPENK